MKGYITIQQADIEMYMYIVYTVYTHDKYCRRNFSCSFEVTKVFGITNGSQVCMSIL